MRFIAIVGNRLKLKPVLLVLFLALALPAFGQGAKLELKNLEKLSSKAADVTDISLDGPMLQFAAKFLEKDDSEEAEIKDLVKNLKGVYVKSFEFDKENQYSQADVDAIRTQLTGPGWTKLVESRSNRDHEINEIFLMKENDAVLGVAILVAEPRELTIVNIVGPIDMNRFADLENIVGHTHHTSENKTGDNKMKTKPAKGMNDNEKK